MAVKNPAKVKTEDKVIVDTPVEKPSLPSVNKVNNRVSFFYDMIAADVFRFRNIERDSAMISLANRIQEETGREDGGLFLSYAERIVYVDEMYFLFTDDVPEEYRNIETWWKMVQAGNDPSECYVWYLTNIPNAITNLFADAVDSAHTIWKPASQQTMKKEKEAETDPN